MMNKEKAPVLKYIVKGHPPWEKAYNFFKNVITTKLEFINQCVH